MAETTVNREGGCRCGQVRFRITAPPLMTVACHCTGCQQMTASAFSLSAAIPTGGFAVTEGEPVRGGLRKPPLEHFFCPDCKSWIFTRFIGMDHFVNVRATLLDVPGDWATPFVETFTSEKLDWVATPAVHRFDEFPPMDAWDGLMRDYADRFRRIATPPSRAG